MSTASDLKISHEGHVALVEITRPPHNFFDFDLIQQIASTFEELDKNPSCRAIVLASKAPHFVRAPISTALTTKSVAQKILAPIHFILKQFEFFPARNPSLRPFKVPLLAAAWVWLWWPISE